MRGKITKRSVDSLRTDLQGEVTLWDSEIKGFGVRLRAGGALTYLVRYRPGTGGRGSPLRTYTIGRHGSPWTPNLARDEAKRILGMVAEGADPAQDHSMRRQAPTVADLAARFLAEHVEPKRKNRTALEYQRLIELHIVPFLGSRKVSDVSRTDASKLHHALRATPYQANRVLAVLGKMLNLAEHWGLRPDGSNPCRHVDKFPEKSRERMLSADELARLGKALADYSGSPYTIAAIKLLVFTGARLSEILGLRWDWISFERCEARLPDSKTGAKTIHLAPPALAVLNELPRLEDCPFVIAGRKASSALVNLEKPWRHIRTAAGLNDVRLHDLRHAFASIAVASGMGLPIIGKMLGHSQSATTARYAHLASDPVKAAAEVVANRIERALQSENDGDFTLVRIGAS